LTVTPLTATHLAVTTEPPSTVVAGAPFGLVVAAEDQYGNVATTFTGQVTASPSYGVAGLAGIFGGTNQVTAVGGVATFSDLTVGVPGTSFVANLTATGLTSATTTSVTVVQPAQVQFAVGSATVLDNSYAAPIQIVRASGYQGAFSVHLETSGGTAVPGVNYGDTNTTVNFAAGEDSVTIGVPVIDTGVFAADVTVNIVLSNPSSSAVLGSPSVETVTIHNTAMAPPLVSMDSVDVIKKKGRVKELVIGFSAGVNATEADSLSTYTLTVAGKKGSFTARNAKQIKLLSAVYDSANDTVALTPKRPFVLTKKVQLLVDGVPPSGLQDTYGRNIDGNQVAVLSGKTVTIDAVTASSALVDLMLPHTGLARLTAGRRGSR
jgi:Calx-beta domain